MTTSEPQTRGKLPARYATIILPLVLSVVMTFVVSAISTLKSLGPTPAFVATWPVAWGISWVVAFPTLLAAAGAADRGAGGSSPAANALSLKEGRPHTPLFPHLYAEIPTGPARTPRRNT